jgi:hypothetical protein
MSRDFDPLGSSFSLEVSNVSVIELLNRVIRDSQTNYGVVVRNGERKEYRVLYLCSCSGELEAHDRRRGSASGGGGWWALG